MQTVICKCDFKTSPERLPYVYLENKNNTLGETSALPLVRNKSAKWHCGHHTAISNNDIWSVISEIKIKELEKSTHNSIKNRGSTLILTNLVQVYPRNTYTKFVTNPGIGLIDKVKNG